MTWSKSDEEEYTALCKQYEICLKHVRHYADRLDTVFEEICNLIERNIDD
jgi:hypothetical protein